mgnify:CR=1 FL=1
MNKRRSIFLSAISGNVLEYYDFTVYAVFSLAIDSRDSIACNTVISCEIAGKYKLVC